MWIGLRWAQTLCTKFKNRSEKMNWVVSIDALTAIVATGLALSKVTTASGEVRTNFDPERDQAAVAQLLTAGCAHMRNIRDVEDLKRHVLTEVAMEDPKGLAGA